jgi:hypothetical protein
MDAIIFESYGRFEIEWVSVHSIGPCSCGIELHCKDGNRRLRVGFIDGYEWYHQMKGQCRVLVLSPDSNEWGDLASISENVLSDFRESVHEVLREIRLHGHVKGLIYALANA